MATATMNLGLKLAGSVLGLMVLAGCGAGVDSYDSQAPTAEVAGEASPSPAPVAPTPTAPAATATAPPASQPNLGAQSDPVASPPRRWVLS